MRSSIPLCLVAAGLSILPFVAHAGDTKVTDYPACTTPPGEAERKGAQGAFAAGEASFKEADYATAITYWKDAYRRDCTAHALLRNLATAFELKGDRAEAVHALETYLQRKPNDPEADAIRRRIKNLEEQLAASSAKSAPTASATPAAASAPAPSAATPPTTEPDRGAQPSQGGKSIAPWILTGAGGLATIAGVVVYLGGQSKVKDAENACPSHALCPGDVADKGNSGRRQETLGGVVAGVGLAAVAGGLVWHFVFDKGSTTQAKTTVAPSVGPGFAGVSVGTRF